MLEGFMIEEGADGAGTSEGLGPRRLRISRSSKSESTSEMSPSEGSLSDTSSIRACDMAVVVVGRELGDGVAMMVGGLRCDSRIGAA